MKELRPIEISNGAFNFCKYSISAVFWLSLILQNQGIVVLGLVILVFSYVLKVKRAPLVVLYTISIEKLFPTKPIILDENSVRFAHLVGSIFALIGLVLLLSVNQLAGWIIIALLALLKTSGALGFCGAMKLYGCLTNPNGQCCRVGKKVKSCM